MNRIKKLVFVYLLVALLVGCGANEAEKVCKESNNASEISKNDLVGTYIGVDGSGLTLFDDNSAEYFWKEYEDVDTSCKWDLKSNRVNIFLDSLNYDVYADIESVKFSSLILKSNSKGWSDEEFVKISSVAKKCTVEEYIAMIERQLGIQIETTKDDYEEKASTETIEASDLQESTGIDPVIKESLDALEQYVDEQVEKYSEASLKGDVSLINDYKQFVEEYTEAVEEFWKLDLDSMGEEELQYCKNVLLRTNQKVSELKYDDNFVKEDAGKDSDSTEKKKSDAAYNMAFVRNLSDYSVYYLMDTNNRIVRQFTSDDKGVLYGRIIDQYELTFTIEYDYDGSKEVISVAKDYASAILTDANGFDWEYERISVNEAENILKQPGYHDMKN